jgi:benzoate membrane transport protein
MQIEIRRQDTFAGSVSGLCYVIAAIFAGVISTFYKSFPIELTSILAGIALLPVIIAALQAAIEESTYRDAAVVTFLITISGISGWGTGAPFWGILAGAAIYRLEKIFK